MRSDNVIRFADLMLLSRYVVFQIFEYSPAVVSLAMNENFPYPSGIQNLAALPVALPCMAACMVELNILQAGYVLNSAGSLHGDVFPHDNNLSLEQTINRIS
jgi:hypothetical protein